MKTIKQRTLNDCGICSVAMFSGQSYAKVKELAFSLSNVFGRKRFNGFYDKMDQVILWSMNIQTIEHGIDHVFKMGGWKKVAPNFEEITKNKPAIFCLPSLNFEGCNHLVYWDGKSIKDPSNLKKYTKKTAFKHVISVIVRVK